MYKKVIMICFLMLTTLGCQESESLSKEQGQEKETSIEVEIPNVSEAADDGEEAAETEPSTDHAEKTTTSKKKQGEVTVDYIDVGQGDATLIQYIGKKQRYTILYDTGDWLGNEVVPFLKAKKIDFIDLVMISHPHADHIGQLEKVMETFDVGEVWMSGNSANSEVFQKALQAVLDSDANYDEPKAGSIYDIGPLTITILHPETLTGNLNEDSLSFHLAYENVSFIFTGDAGKKEERYMLQGGLPIEADYIQLGHHGSNTSSDNDFIEAVNPSAAIYSAGKDNAYGHPHKEVVSMFEKKGIPIYGTDKVGTITVTTNGQDSKIETEAERTEAERSNKQTFKTNNHTHTTEKCIDVNTANIEKLTNIIHIGEARAKKMIAARPFHSVDDLIYIKGIGEKRLQEIKQEGKACIGGDN